MGRRQFRQDLATAAQQPPAHIGNVRTTDDGEISFDYIYSEFGRQRTAALQLLALNVDDYPHENEYMIFARDNDVHPKIVNSLELLCPIVRNKTISDALAEISNCLYQAVTSGESSNPIVLETSDAEEDDLADQGDEDDEEDGADDWFDDDDDETFGFTTTKKPGPVAIGRASIAHLAAEDRKKVKADLREAKDAGFRVGVIGDLNTSGIVSVSIRISKLGISEEVTKAWGLEFNQYFVLLIRCQNGYRSIENIKEESTLSGSTEVRLGLCYSYKPNVKSAFDAFNEITQSQKQQSQASQTTSSKSSSDMLPLFIGGPLNELFLGRFSRIVKFRDVYSLGWAGAEQLVHDTQGAITDTNQMWKYDAMSDNETGRALPAIVMADVMSEQRLKHCSMPLVAMQFALRHFVRCTDFCLVCHCASSSTFEALKPYVCSNPLCLYQYMALGFGPSIEWEILSQPCVVDLLISFCYVQAQAGRLKDFPVGIDLKVPILPQFNQANTAPSAYPAYNYQNPQPTASTGHSPPPEKAFSVPYNAGKHDLLFPSDQVSKAQLLRKGDFIVLTHPVHFSGAIYHRVEEVMAPSVSLGPPTHVNNIGKDDSKAKRLPQEGYFEVDCYLFSHSFDEMSNDYKAKAIIAMLDTIPPVKEMVQYLQTHSFGQDSSLRQWRDRISPSALNILRWIIASNRSCIMQVDTVLAPDAVSNAQSREDRITGMNEYMQFRFAQGAPDKEQRFIDCVKKETEGSQYPTLFAWHGSPLHNWHSIIREGLHHNETHHGRAYGNGVYMSPHANTSTGYSSMYGPYGRGGSASGWQNSELKITSALSLNEVVNKPASFVSSSPHYVVAENDWIQTRYLLVKTSAQHTKGNRQGMETLTQDPSRKPLGDQGTPVEIPITAISKSRRPKQDSDKRDTSRKRKSIGSGLPNEPIELPDDDAESVATLNEDREYLLDDESHTGHTPIVLDSDTEMMLSEDELDGIASPRKKLRQEEMPEMLPVVDGCMLDSSKTDFVPGKLDMSNIKILPPPDDASRTATNSLLKAFNALLKAQSVAPAHELGWYINPNGVENMYQWIVELHSFDKDIPLAQDMTKEGITSVVLEMRFTNQYPFAPPFVRVIKPRFLPFNQGGGGHVTEGGAICMELLTNNGWSAVSSIESVLLQIRLAMSEKERPARLPGYGGHGYGRGGVYGVGEAIEAYERACRAHGWTVPPAFASLQRGDGQASRGY
ncbi:hypothetical protein OHC33_007202 [Knufia fluminis]|uniref:UBC core domain-containing protein n=1 Tax=Knufia fluminis TaxID=191047 RepID=A0AAN8EC03_9EURO|nr:hypothetical protein OHC33_007202 [Knufia fluminis]